MTQPVALSFTGYIGNDIVIKFNTAFDAPDLATIANRFEVTIDGSPETPTSVTVDNTAMTVTLHTASALSDGTRIDQITYIDPAGNQTTGVIQALDGTDVATFTLDMPNPLYSTAHPSEMHWIVTAAPSGPVPPSVPVLAIGSDSGISGSDGITKIATPAVTGTGIAGATVHLYDGTTDIGTAIVAVGGAWSITPSIALTDGPHTLSAKQTDGTGTSLPGAALTVVIDTVIATPGVPSVAAGSDTGGSNTDGITSNTTPTIIGTAEANSTVTLYDTDNTTIVGSGTANGSGLYSLAVSALSPGSHTITARATDLAGNVSTVSSGAVVFIDTAGPTGLALSTTSANTTAAINGATIATLAATDASSIAYSLVTGNGTNDADNPKFTISGTSLVAAQNLTAGAYHIYVQAADAAGNNSLQTFVLNVVSGPSVTSIVRASAASATVPSADASVAYTVTFSEAVTGVDQNDFTLTRTGNAAGTIASISTTDNVTYTVTVNGLGGDGTISLNLNATGTGIQSSGAAQAIVGGFTSGQTYTLDHTAPARPSLLVMTAGTDTGISSSDSITSNTTPTFAGTGEIGSVVKVIDFNSGNAVIGTATVDGTGHYSITVSALTPGVHLLNAYASDAAGNLSSITPTLTVFIDTVAPTAILLPTSTVYTNAGLNAAVGTLGATDVGGAGAFLYQLVPGVGAANNADFTITNGVLILNDPSAVGIATESIRVRVTDAAGNSYTQVLEINVTTAPPAGGGTPPATLVDGVPVTTTTTTLPSGSSGTMVTIPVVIAGQGAVDGSPNVADIPLVTANSTSMLMAQVPVGTGLTATAGTSKTAGNSLTELISSIKAQTATHDTTDQSHLTGNGTQFLKLLSPDVPLLVSTVVVKNVDATASTPLTLTGTSSAAQHTALVIDTSQLASNSSIVLNSVDFAAVVGAVTITGNTAGQVITGDVANQHVIVTAGTASQVHAGGGNDVLQYGLATNLALSAIDNTAQAANAASLTASPTIALVANSTTSGSLTAATSVLLNGGTGADTASFVKAQSAYTIDQRDGYVLVTDKADATQQITVTNVETLQFTDGSVTVQSRAELTTIAGLYQTVLGRQADIGGFNYWGASQASGASLGSVAVSMLNSSEAIARGFGLNGDATHDVTTLYQALFGRAPDAGGLAYWTDAMAHGQTLVDVANGFAASQEMNGHKLATTSWDLVF